MKRIVVVYNRKSASFFEINKNVIVEARKLKGWIICKFEVNDGSILENTLSLAGIIRNGDLVLAAGEDRTIMITMNAIMKSRADATFALMPFGDYCYYLEMFDWMSFEEIVSSFEEGKSTKFYPIEVKTNEHHYVYAGINYSLGLMAELTRFLKSPKPAAEIKKRKFKRFFLIRMIFSWFIKNRRRAFLPSDLNVDGKRIENGAADYVVMNGRDNSGELFWGKPEVFQSGIMRNQGLLRVLARFFNGSKKEDSIGSTKTSTLVFNEPYNICACIDGVDEVLKGVLKVEIHKDGKSLRVVRA